MKINILRRHDLFSYYRTMLLSGVVLCTPLPSPANPGDSAACISAIQGAEQKLNIPDNLLLAMGYTEASMRGIVWPWTLNRNGKARYFATYEDALIALRTYLAMGETNIDVGCLQLNLNWVGRGLAPEDALDPAFNVSHAARHLNVLRNRHGSWTAAVGRYHSGNPKRRLAYACRVYEWLTEIRSGIRRRADACLPQ